MLRILALRQTLRFALSICSHPPDPLFVLGIGSKCDARTVGRPNWKGDRRRKENKSGLIIPFKIV
jgi:hypothetical protein